MVVQILQHRSNKVRIAIVLFCAILVYGKLHFVTLLNNTFSTTLKSPQSRYLFAKTQN